MEQKLINLIEPISKSFEKKSTSISTLVSFNTSPEAFTYRFPTPIILSDYDYEIALVNLENGTVLQMLLHQIISLNIL